MAVLCSLLIFVHVTYSESEPGVQLVEGLFAPSHQGVLCTNLKLFDAKDDSRPLSSGSEVLFRDIEISFFTRLDRLPSLQGIK